jgi:hypothetical protein
LLETDEFSEDTEDETEGAVLGEGTAGETDWFILRGAAGEIDWLIL